jgi:hypothetical protein
MSNAFERQLADVVNRLLYLSSDSNDAGNGRSIRDHLLGAAAAANTVINAASGGVPVIGPPKKRVVAPTDQGEPSIVLGYAYSGGVVVIGPPKRIDVLVAELIEHGIVPVPRAYPDLSAWIEWHVPGSLRAVCLNVVAAQFEAAKAWAPDDIQNELARAVEQLHSAVFP